MHRGSWSPSGYHKGEVTYQLTSLLNQIECFTRSCFSFFFTYNLPQYYNLTSAKIMYNLYERDVALCIGTAPDDASAWT